MDGLLRGMYLFLRSAMNLTAGLLLYVLVIFPAVRSSCIDGSDLRNYYLKQSHSNLKSLGPRLPSDCSEEAMSIRIKKRPKNVRRIRSLEQAIRLSSELFSEDLRLVKWDQSRLRTLQELLGRQKVIYSDCNPTPKKTKGKMMEGFFKDLKDFLSKENHSLCAWEVVRAEMESLFEALMNSPFNVKMKNP